jgi:chromosome segregation ATPase
MAETGPLARGIPEPPQAVSRSPTRNTSPSNVIRGKQLKQLRIQNDQLEEELQRLRLSYRSMDRFSDTKDHSVHDFAHKRFALESCIRELDLELEVLDREIAKRRNSQTKVLEEQSENELRLAELLKEEKVLNARRQLKLDQRKEDLKLETKRQLAMMNIEKRLVESDIQAFTEAIARMQQLRGNRARAAPDSVPASPENRQQLFARLAEVRRDIATLEDKCRTLQNFVAVRSPTRYSEIMNDRRRVIPNPDS